MKRTIGIIALAACTLGARPLDREERDFLLSSLHASRKVFLDSIAGLSEAQWNFKPGPDRWSIAQIAEHVILTEDMLNGMARKTMETPAIPDRKVERSADEAILKRMEDRTEKAKNPPELAPEGRYATPKAAADAFREKRDHTLEYARTTQEDLRAHVTESPRGNADVYQLLLVLAGHANRHVAQIKEVKADSNYPQK